MSSDRAINHEGSATQDNSFARAAAASHWGRPEGSQVGTPRNENFGRPGGSQVGAPADIDARANAALQQGFQNVGDIYKSSFDSHMGSPYPDGGTTGGAGGMGSPRPDGTYDAGGVGSSRPDGTIVGTAMPVGAGTDVSTTAKAGESLSEKILDNVATGVAKGLLGPISWFF